MGTEDQGWVAHFAKCALAGQPISIFGDGCQVRDILYVDDAVEAYLAAWRRIGKVSGRAFNLGGGPQNAISLLQLIRYLEALLDRRIAIEFGDWRVGDQRYFVSDATLARRELGLGQATGWRDGVAKLVAWLQRRQPARAPAVSVRPNEPAGAVL
jgi:CDP-paratose 2-epimerase